MNTIFKYPLEFTLLNNSRNTILMPYGAMPLTVRMQGLEMFLWAQVSREPGVNQWRHFDIYGTGHDMPENPGVYVDTVEQGVFIWHIFDATWVKP